MGWVKDTVQSRVPAWGVVTITAAAVGAVSASLAVIALGRVTDRGTELAVESEVEE
jgi:hypothetical protein